jgi:hypothetical protein
LPRASKLRWHTVTRDFIIAHALGGQATKTAIWTIIDSVALGSSAGLLCDIHANFPGPRLSPWRRSFCKRSCPPPRSLPNRVRSGAGRTIPIQRPSVVALQRSNGCCHHRQSRNGRRNQPRFPEANRRSPALRRNPSPAPFLCRERVQMLLHNLRQRSPLSLCCSRSTKVSRNELSLRQLYSVARRNIRSAAL